MLRRLPTRLGLLSLLVAGWAQAQAPPDFDSATVIPEDLNADGTVDAADLRLFRVDRETLNARSDVNGDGKVNLADAQRILALIVYCEEHGAYRKPVARADIGRSGGTLNGPGFRLTVPAGAFGKTVRLLLYRLPGTAAAEVGSASYTYELQGLPLSFVKPLTLALASAAASSRGGLSFIRMSELGFAKSAGKLMRSAIPLDAKSSGGSLVAQIPATGGGTSATDGLGALGPIPLAPVLAAGGGTPETTRQPIGEYSTWYSVTNMQAQLISSAENFRFVYPLSEPGLRERRIKKLADFAERALAILKDPASGYGLSGWRRDLKEYPIDVWVLPLPPDAKTGERTAYTVASKVSVNRITIQANSLLCKTDKDGDRLAAAVGHEFFHVWQYLYDNRTPWAQNWTDTDWAWFEEATATDLEFELGKDLVAPGQPWPIPTTVWDPDPPPGKGGSENWAFPGVHGLEYPKSEGAMYRDHGYGASLFVRDELTKYLVGWIFRKHYDKPALQPVTLIGGARGSVPGLRAAYQDFVLKWLQGQVFANQGHPDWPNDKMLIGAHRKASFVGFTKGSNGRRQTFNLQDLSLWLMRLGPDPTQPGYGRAKFWVEIKGLAKDRFLVPYFIIRPDGGLDYGGTLTASGAITKTYATCQGVLLAIVNLSAANPYTRYAQVTVGVQQVPWVGWLNPPGGKPGTLVTIPGWGFGKTPGQLKLRWASSTPTPPKDIAFRPTKWGPTEIQATIPTEPAPAPGAYSLIVVMPQGPGGRGPTGNWFTAAAPFTVQAG